MQPTGGARAKARSAEPCEPASRGKEQCGAALAWPRLRRHLADKLPRTADLGEKAEPIKIPRDVAQSSFD